MANLSHWATIDQFLRREQGPSWVHGEDLARVQSYDVYEAIYWTAPESYQITMRGQEGQPIYVPSGRQIVDVAHQYMAPGFNVVEDPEFGTDAQRSDAKKLFAGFAARERFYSKFSANKLVGIMRADWLWHIMADPDKPSGARISAFTLHPGSYFPEYLDDDVETIIAVNITEPTLSSDGKPAVNVLRYEKETGESGPSPIIASSTQFESEAWGQPGTDMDMKAIRSLVEPQVLPAPIDSIPVYHIPNYYDPDFGWGSSEMRGIERLMRGINQAITDEELALVLEGLGVYVTDAGAPLDEDGEETAWTIAPGRVVELPGGKTFGRVAGVGSVDPYMAHLSYLHKMIDQTVGANDITKGSVDVSVAESGIALALRMAPILTRMGEKELVITDVMTQMLYDLRKWFISFENLAGVEDIRWVPRYSEKLPVNKAQSFTEIMAMVTATPPIISPEEARRMLTKLGYTFSDEAQLTGEIMRTQQETLDAEAARILGGVSGP